MIIGTWHDHHLLLSSTFFSLCRCLRRSQIWQQGQGIATAATKWHRCWKVQEGVPGVNWQTCRLGRRSSHPPRVLYKAVASCRWVPHLALENWCHPEHMRVERNLICLFASFFMVL